MANKQVKGCPASLEKCKSKLQNMRYHLTPIRMAITKKKKNLQTIYAGEGVEKREAWYTVGGNVN